MREKNRGSDLCNSGLNGVITTVFKERIISKEKSNEGLLLKL